MNTDSIGTKPDLRGVGTRYDHYQELKEVFMQGVEIINQMSMRSEGDRRTKAKLEIAVEMIDKRIDYLSDFSDLTHSGSPLAREVRAAGIHKTPQLEKTNEKQPKTIDQPRHSEDSST